MKQTLLFLLVFCLAKAQAQVVVASGTTGMVDAQTQMAFDFQSGGNISIDPSAFDFKNAAFTFLGNVNPNVTIVGSNPLTIESLTMNSTGSYRLNQGTIEVTKKLDLVGGIFSVTGSNTKLLYSGTDNLSGSVSSYIDGKLFMKGSGPRTFPIGIGSTGVYLPVTLGDVKTSDAATEIGFQAILGDPGVPSSALTADIKDVFTDHYWMLSNGNSGTYSGSLISLSLNNTDPFFVDGDPIILELDASGNLNNLLGISAFPDVASTKEGAANGQKYALAKSNAITVRIHRVITPNGDGDNDNLYIEGIDFYTTNTVKLVDRWGVVHFTKENFKNYTTQNPADFDFSRLSNGNYICVVELGSGVKVTPKMISVIK
jgi:hypothetical protein